MLNLTENPVIAWIEIFTLSIKQLSFSFSFDNAIVRSSDPAGGQYRLDYRNDRRRGRRPFNNDAGRALQRLGLPTAVSHLQSQVQAGRGNENDWYKITVCFTTKCLSVGKLVD